MIAYWKNINFIPETTDMNDVDKDETEKEAETIQTKDQVKGIKKKASADPTMKDRYGGVVIKGFKKEVPLEDTVEVLKEAGLPFDYGKVDLQTCEKAGNMTIYVHDLKSETCMELVNNLHGEDKLGHRISVFALVEDTPTKALGESLEKMIAEEVDIETPNVQSDDIEDLPNGSNNLPTPLTPLNSSPSKPNQGMFQNIVSDLSRFWNNSLEDESDEDSTDEELNQLREQFKRKAETSPDNDAMSEFETILSKKEKKKLKKSLNKSK